MAWLQLPGKHGPMFLRADKIVGIAQHSTDPMDAGVYLDGDPSAYLVRMPPAEIMDRVLELELFGGEPAVSEG